MTTITVPSEFDAHTLAEYIEAFLLLVNSEDLTFQELVQHFPTGQQPTDTDMSFAATEIARRARLMGQIYPYAVEQRTFKRLQPTGHQVYDFLLLMSLRDTPVRLEGDYARSDPLFDTVVREAARAWLGDGAIVLEFGYPVRGGRPSDFSEAVSWVGASLGVRDRALDRPQSYKDGGVDIIAARPDPDGRQGYPIYLIQNTVRMEYAKKPRDPLPLEWFRWLDLPKPPLTGFAIPFLIPHDDPRWLEVAQVADLPLDRVRLSAEVGKGSPMDWPEYTEIAAFVMTELATVGATADNQKGPSVTRRRKPPKR